LSWLTKTGDNALLSLSKKTGGPSYIFAFLGNPGSRYAVTRHNAGFIAGAALVKRLGLGKPGKKFKSETYLIKIGGKSVLLLFPQTFMNLSGEAVAAAAKFYKLPPENIVAVCDESLLDIGVIRLRQSGGHGGQNGMRSIIERLGTEDFPRIRIGVGKKPVPEMDIADWVLSPFRGQELADIERVAAVCADCVTEIVHSGLMSAMNKYSNRNLLDGQ
jgi:PTH1 family peptidyl-tRNA hydrolase